jgi:hypothetical protein
MTFGLWVIGSQRADVLVAAVWSIVSDMLLLANWRSGESDAQVNVGGQ